MVVGDPEAPGGERTKLLDFGIAKLGDAQDFVKTRTNAMLGTPIYMSPEQCRGAGKVDDRADVYSFGVLLFVMVAGRPPFSGEGMGDVMGKHMYEQPPPLESFVPSVPAPLADLIARLLTKDKQQRPPMHEVVGELQQMAQNLESLPVKTGAGPISLPGAMASGVSTLGAAGQAQAADSKRPGPFRRPAVAALVLVGLLLPAALVVPALTRKPVGKPVGKQEPAQGSAQSVVSPAPEPPAAGPRKVRWKIDTLPAGATVTSELDGSLLCRTPCVQERAVGTGQARLRLAREGFADRTLVLAEDHDVERTETLDPLRRPLLKGKRILKPAGPAVAAAPTPSPEPLQKPVPHARPKIED